MHFPSTRTSSDFSRTLPSQTAVKSVKLYNVIFPIWIVLFLPPVIYIILAGNFVIDSLVIFACFYIYKLAAIQNSLRLFYLKSILKVWLYGFLADIIGAVILFIIGFWGVSFGIDKLSPALEYDPWSHPAAVIIVICAMLVSGWFIFILNYKNTFNKLIEEKKLRFKVAVTTAIITMPWTFLLPSEWFYHGL